MTSNITTADRAGWAFFLDVDGTLLEMAETPDLVYVSQDLKQLLCELVLRLDGALALVSGRTIRDLDRLFAPLRFCASGVHGCERREASGCIVTPTTDPEILEPVRAELRAYVDRYPGLLLEDKGFGLALHFRRVPELERDVLTLMLDMCRTLEPAFTLQPGKYVVEIRPAGFTKGTSIAALMLQAPFHGRIPVFIGDDVTDEDGFAVVNELGGLTIKVGNTGVTLAQRRLHGVHEVRDWLRTLPLHAPLRPERELRA